MIPADNVLGRRRQTDVRHRRAESLLAQYSGMKTGRSGDKADSSMSQDGKVLYGLGDSFCVIYRQSAHSLFIGSHVDENQRNSAGGQPIEHRLFDTEGHHRRPLDIALQHAIDDPFHEFGIVTGRANQNLISKIHGDVFKALNQLRKKRIRDIRDNEAEQARPS